MKTIVTLYGTARHSSFTVTGHPSDVSDRIVRIKRALKIKLTHGTQGV